MKKKKTQGDPKEPDKGTLDDIDFDNLSEEDVKNIKNLQRIISEKDRETKDALQKLEELEKKDKEKKEAEEKKADEKKTEQEKENEELIATIKSLNERVDKINKKERLSELKTEYPDIEPELLIGLNDEALGKIVEKQRAINKKNYGDSHKFIKPDYENVDDVQKAIDRVKADEGMSGETKATEVLRLTREKENFNQ